MQTINARDTTATDFVFRYWLKRIHLLVNHTQINTKFIQLIN